MKAQNGRREHRGIFSIDSELSFLGEEPELDVASLGAGLWTVSDGRYRTVFAEGTSSVVAWDTFRSPGRARAYAAAIKSTVPGKPLRTVVISNDHLDRSGFGADLAPEADILAHEWADAAIRERGADGQLPANRTLRGGRNALELDGVRVELIYPGPTSATGNLATYLPKQKILYFPETVLPNARYSMLPDYHIRNFSRSIRSLLSLDFDTFVPGRYAVMDRRQFERACDYFDAVHEAAQGAFAESVAVWLLDATEAYVKGRLRAEWGELDGFDEHVGIMAFRIAHHYLMGGWSLEDTDSGELNLAGVAGLEPRP